MVRNYWHFRNVCQDGFKVDSAKEKEPHWNTVEIKLSIRGKKTDTQQIGLTIVHF